MSTRRRKYTRRAFITAGVLAAGGAVAGTGGYFAFQAANEPVSNIGDVPFDTPLKIPPLLDPQPDEQGRRHFELTMQTGQSQLVPAGPTMTWGVNGPYLGPTLRAKRSDQVTIAVHNKLPEKTTLHWHGMHLPARYDGGPHQMIPVGESWYPEWMIDQPASTLWYHPHMMGKTAEHVYRGAVGMFLIDDDESERLDLPKEYGVDDIPVIIQDKNFNDDGELSLSAGGFLEQMFGSSNFGILGDTILVNGTYGPVFEPTRTLTRFRILNGSNARFYNLGFADERPFRLLATGNGFLPGEPVELSRLLLGPAERAEIIVEVSAGDDVMLRSHEHDLGESQNRIGHKDTFDILRIRAPRALEPSPDLPVDIGSGNVTPEVPSDATERDFELMGHSRINGKHMDMARIDQVIPANALEIWNVVSSSHPHTFHIHGATFHVLEVDGGEPAPDLRGPKDMVFVGPDHAVKLAVQFESYTDPDAPYMYHCHLLQHEDNGMMGQFVVVEPGTESSVSTRLTIDEHQQ